MFRVILLETNEFVSMDLRMSSEPDISNKRSTEFDFDFTLAAAERGNELKYGVNKLKVKVDLYTI